jgi:hypothetical protein
MEGIMDDIEQLKEISRQKTNLIKYLEAENKDMVLMIKQLKVENKNLQRKINVVPEEVGL